MTKLKVYDKMAAIKPEIRDILWAYKRTDDLGKAVDKMGELLNDVWNCAMEEAGKAAQNKDDYYSSSYYTEAIKKLKL